jgi:hypothetical protein
LIETETLGLASPPALKLGMRFEIFAQQDLTKTVEIEQTVITHENNRFGELKRGEISSREKKPNLS